MFSYLNQRHPQKAVFSAWRECAQASRASGMNDILLAEREMPERERIVYTAKHAEAREVENARERKRAAKAASLRKDRTFDSSTRNFSMCCGASSFLKTNQSSFNRCSRLFVYMLS